MRFLTATKERDSRGQVRQLVCSVDKEQPNVWATPETDLERAVREAEQDLEAV